MTRTIEVEPYNPDWPEKYHHEARQLTQIFASQLISIHHIGSTAIPGIKAKPVIDIMVVVHEIDQVEQYNSSMIGLGYSPRGEYGIPGRRYFPKVIDDVHSHHVHVYSQGHKDITLLLNFRDYLRDHPEQALAYSQLKEKLAQKFRYDSAGYTEAKTDFVKNINLLAAQWREQQHAADD
jgi:GrpB-like predicted nucleotidyltransferase (UPF0157 family)